MARGEHAGRARGRHSKTTKSGNLMRIPPIFTLRRAGHGESLYLS